MKTRSIARGIVGSVAALLGVMAAGCSADVAPGEAAEIGSTAEALSFSDVTAGTALPVALKNASSCIIDNGSGTKYVVIAGGETASGFSDKAYLLDGSTWRSFTFTSNLSSGTSKAAMIVRPGHADQCLLFGGEVASASKQSGVLLLTFATVNSHPGLTISNAGSMLTARSRHQVVPCGTDSVAVLGGNAGIDSVEVWHGQTGTSNLATLKKADESTVVTLNAARTDFSAVSVSATHFAVGGGKDSNGKLSSVEAFTVKDDLSTTILGCKLADDDDSDAHYTLSSTITARDQLGGYLTATADTVAFLGGDTGGSTASQKISTVFIDWLVPANSTVSEANDLAIATIGPAVVKIPSGNAYAFGGSVRNYQESDGTPWSSATKYSDNTTNIPIRAGATAVSLPGGSIYVMGGDNSGTVLSSVDLVTP